MTKREAGGQRSRSRADVLEKPDYGWIWKPLLVLLVVYLLVVLALGFWWSRPPAAFDVEQATAAQRGAVADSPSQAATATAQRGAVTLATLMTLVDTLLEKPGGYLRNDVAPPGVWLDNMPSWEYGVLIQARDLAGALPAMAEGEAEVLSTAHERLMHDSRDWLYPGTEQPLAEAVDALGDYLQALSGDSAGLAAQGDGLALWLEQVSQRLDALGLRLSASVGSRDAVRHLDLDAESLPEKTPWYRVDNVFFEARGTGWALLHLLQGVQRDHADLIEAAGVMPNWERLIAELERTQRRVWSPVILNGSGFGLFANHSLVMANHVVRSRDLVRSLIDPLAGQSVEADDTEPADDTKPTDEAVEEPVDEARGTETT